MENIQKLIAKDLLSIKAVFFRPEEPFTWASGIKSPIYCDNRIVLSYPESRTVIEDGLAELIKREYPEVEAVFGTATAGIAHAAMVAERLNLPTGYVRGENKSHGRQNKIEGRLEKGQKVVVVEDLISTGGSSLKAVEALRKDGSTVLGMMAIFSYGFPVAEANFKKANVELTTLCNYDAVLRHALEIDYISQDEIATLQEWRKDPANWKK